MAMDEYVRELFQQWPLYKHANAEHGRCRDCRKVIGLSDGQCTGWHPSFKCACGYETSHPAAAKWKFCIHCGVGKQPSLGKEVTPNESATQHGMRM